VILKTHLNNFIRKPKHDGVLRAHPLLNIDYWLGLAARSFILHINI